MDIKPIKTDADYREALKQIEGLMMAMPDTEEGERLDVMVTLVEAYESKHHALDLPDPVEAIKFEMERKGLSVKDLEPMIGKSNRVYEVLNRKRALTLPMIRRLNHSLGIPAESLINLSKKVHA
ncbi:MAG: transcriptional regulator [Pseudomonadota bacterium]